MSILDVIVVTGDVDISGSNVRLQSAFLYETIDKGMFLTEISGAYRSTNNATQTGANFRVVALQAGISGDFISTVRSGPMTFGAGLISSGTLYGIGTGNGGFGDITGLVTSDWVTTVGFGINDDYMFVNPSPTNKQRQ